MGGVQHRVIGGLVAVWLLQQIPDPVEQLGRQPTLPV